MNTEAVPELTYAISHDLGEPVREVVGFTRLLRESAPEETDERFWAHLSHIEAGAARAQDMLHALVDFIRVDDTAPLTGLVDLAALFDDAMLRTEDIRTRFPSVVSADVSGRTQTFPDVVHGLLVELITNAARFGTSDDGVARLTVTAHATDGAVIITVADDGPGIPHELTEQAFRLFQRLGSRTEHDTLGAGLALMRRRIERCGGTLRLGPATPLGGLLVTASIPTPAIDLRPVTPALRATGTSTHEGTPYEHA